MHWRYLGAGVHHHDDDDQNRRHPAQNNVGSMLSVKMSESEHIKMQKACVEKQNMEGLWENVGQYVELQSDDG